MEYRQSTVFEGQCVSCKSMRDIGKKRGAVKTGLMLIAILTMVAIAGAGGRFLFKQRYVLSPIATMAAATATQAKVTVTLPGTRGFSESLLRNFAQKYRQLGSDYRPRTRHLNADGSAKYTNRLFLESSPYLLQHAHNPVNWFPWGDEAFALAKKLNRPVLLSVGYSTCHWCHVMEEESFEDPELARFFNEHYVAIKVDREERPDVDAIYMSAVQALTGRGGWPMTVWLTPERKPFYGGTYFPPRDGDRGARYGFLTLLTELEKAYHQQPQKVLQSSEQLAAMIGQNLAPRSGDSRLPGADLLHSTVAQYQQRFDAEYAGLSGAPKFPSSLPIRLLLRYYRHSADQLVLNMATRTLEKMAAGGMHDQIGGGFHRYSTDAQWLVPHFEKMLYDNALLAMTYLEAWQVTGNPEFKRVTEDILRYVKRDMTSADGAFYSATDADSPTPGGHREEGWFFTWTPAEIDQTLDQPEAQLVKAYYQVTEKGNFAGRTILHTPESLTVALKHLNLSEDRARSMLATAREALYQARLQRPAPFRDEKILTAWNGLMISAFAKAGFALGDDDYTQAAKTAANFILERLYRDGRLYRSYKDGKAHHNAYLDDYAFLTTALLDLYEATFELPWLQRAIVLDRTLERFYEDKQHGGFFMTSNDHETLLAREKPTYDGAEPSGNSVTVLNLLRLHEFTTDDRYRQRAEKALRAFSGTLQAQPTALSEMLLALAFHLDMPKEIIIVTPEGERQSAEPLLAQLRPTFLPNRVVSVVSQGDELDRHATIIPLLKHKRALQNRTTAYVCEQGFCELPTHDPAVFARQIATVDSLRGNTD